MEHRGEELGAGESTHVRSFGNQTGATNQRVADGVSGADSTSTEVFKIISRRASLLAALAAGPRTKADLVAAVSVSRSTVDRGLRELEAIEAVTRCEEGYRLRLPGRLMYQVYQRYHHRIEGVRRATTLLAALPADVPLDPAVVEGANVVTAGGTSLHQPIDRQRALVETADHVRGFWSAIPQYVETYYRRAAAHDLTIALVVRPTVTRHLLTECRAVVKKGLSTGRLTLREHDHDAGPPCNLVVCESEAGSKLGLTVHDDNGVVGFLENESPEAVAWGEAFFERYWTAAEPLGSPDAAATE